MLGRVWGFGTFPSLIPVCRARQAEHGPPQRRGCRLLGVKGPGASVHRHGDSAGPDGARSPGKEKRRSPAQRPGAGPSQTSRQVLALPPGAHGRAGWEVAGHPAWARWEEGRLQSVRQRHCHRATSVMTWGPVPPGRAQAPTTRGSVKATRRPRGDAVPRSGSSGHTRAWRPRARVPARLQTVTTTRTTTGIVCACRPSPFGW